MQIEADGKPLQGQIGDVFHYGEFSIDFNAAKGTFEVQFLMKQYPLGEIIISKRGIAYKFSCQTIRGDNCFEESSLSKNKEVAFGLLKKRVLIELEWKRSNMERWEEDKGRGMIEALIKEWRNKEF